MLAICMFFLFFVYLYLHLCKSMHGDVSGRVGIKYMVATKFRAEEVERDCIANILRIY